MVHKISDAPEIYSIDIPLPDNPLKNLNCYVLKSGDETLVVDTGFRREECATALREGLAALSVSIADATLFITHLHSDHIGLYEVFYDAGATVRMGRLENHYFDHYINGRNWDAAVAEMRPEGFPRHELDMQFVTNPAIIFAPTKSVPVVGMEDGEGFAVGGEEVRCVLTPGHTPFHMCLYLPRRQVMFLGDHVLFDISPNIDTWPHVEDSPGDYLRSLDKIATLPMKLALPAHRAPGDVYARIAEIKAHHEKRLGNILAVIERKADQTCYEIASQTSWRMRGRGWDEFPVYQKWFAAGETHSHLDLLIKRGQVRRTLKGEFNTYNLA